MRERIQRRSDGKPLRRRVDVLIVSTGVTLGLRRDSEELTRSLNSLGYTAETVFMEDKMKWAGPDWLPSVAGELYVAARLRLRTERTLRRVDARAFIYGTSHSTMLQRRGWLMRAAVRIDQPAAINRPGLRGAVQRSLEHRQLRRARMFLPWSTSTAAVLEGRYGGSIVTLAPCVSGSYAARCRRAWAICYAANPHKKGLDVLLLAWAAAGVDDARLIVTGVDEQQGRAFLSRRGVPIPDNVQWTGRLSGHAYRSTVGQSHVFVTASRREEYGIALVEALADGALVVALPGSWPSDPYLTARELDRALVPEHYSVDALAAALRVAFSYPEERRSEYAARARGALEANSPDAWLCRLREEVMPTLLEDASVGYPAKH